MLYPSLFCDVGYLDPAGPADGSFGADKISPANIAAKHG
jgi:hypothetical protein